MASRFPFLQQPNHAGLFAFAAVGVLLTAVVALIASLIEELVPAMFIGLTVSLPLIAFSYRLAAAPTRDAH